MTWINTCFRYTTIGLALAGTTTLVLAAPRQHPSGGTVPGGVVAQISAVIAPSGGTVPIPWGNGGTYEGPGDTVPPGTGGHQIGMCTMNLPPVVCDAWPQCSEGWEWAPDTPRCVWPQFGPAVGAPVLTQGYGLTINTVIGMLENGAECIDQYGNITACVEAPFEVHELHIFQSGWINGYVPDAAIKQAVSPAVCIDHNIQMAGWSFQEIAQSRPCDYPMVCITFNAQCMMQALRDWQSAGIDLSQWGGSWLFYVDFVSCMPCD